MTTEHALAHKLQPASARAVVLVVTWAATNAAAVRLRSAQVLESVVDVEPAVPSTVVDDAGFIAVVANISDRLDEVDYL